MSPPCTRSPAAGLRFVTAARGLTGHKRTARPSALSARCSAAGLTELSTAQAKNARPPLTAGLLQPSTSTLSPRPPTPGQQNQPARVLHLGGSGGTALVV